MSEKMNEHTLNSMKTGLNRHVFIATLIGILLAVIYFFFYHKAKYEIPSGVRMISYISILSILYGLLVVTLRKKLFVLMNLIIIVSLVMILELICFFALDMPMAVKKEFNVPDLPADHVAMNIGTVPYADSVYHALLTNGNDTVYDVLYSIDHYNKRITPNHDTLRNKHALFFGCSIAFGVGVQDNETFPAYFQSVANEYNAYNFAYSGYGANQMLARLEYQNLNEQVIEKDGIGIYVFFWDHIYRSIGTMSRYTDWLMNAPYYELKDDKIIRNKMFSNGRPFISSIYECLYQSNIVRQFEIDFPLALNESHYDLVSEMVAESKRKYKAQFGNDQFYLVFYPSFDKRKTEEMEAFKTQLDKKGIRYFDLTEIITYGPEHTLGGDPHPNAHTHEIIANELLNRLKDTQN